MREIVSLFFDTYTLYSGRGKFLPLFLVSLIILFFAGGKMTKKVHPLLFVLSAWTAVSVAFTGLIASITNKKGRLLACVFFAAVILLAGAPVFSDDNLRPFGDVQTGEREYHTVLDTVLATEPGAKILASPEMMSYFCAFSSGFTPLYSIPAPGHETDLPEEEYKLYEIFQSQNPDFEEVRRLCRRDGKYFAVVDHEKMWPEHILESGFALMTTVDHYDVYVYAGGAHE